MLSHGIKAGLTAFLAATLLPGYAAPETSQYSSAQSTSAAGMENVSKTLSQNQGLVSLYYDSSLLPKDVIERAEKDAQELGLSVVRTLAAGNVVLVKGTMEEVAAKLASSEGLPITKIGPAYRINNSAHPDSQIAFTDLLAIKFAETVNEGQKRAWLNDRGWTRVHETAHGRVFVRTHLEPTWQMIGVAQGLQSNDPMVDRAEYDFITTAELQFSNSLNFEDDLFEFQWPLFASGKNGLSSNLASDEDLDVPRAWKINQRNVVEQTGRAARFIYGNPQVSIGVFDTGIQVSHPDMAENLDSRIGRDFIDGGDPLPPLSLVGLHGLFVSSLIAANNNQVGIVGVVPDSKIYTSRVLAADNSVSATTVISALGDSIQKDLDVNLHAYTFPFTTNDDSVVNQIDASFEETVQAGRDGLGISNFASVGSFWGVVEFPAESLHVIGVTSVSETGSAFSNANWGGRGPDFAMPGTTGAGGIVGADLVGNSGVATTNTSQFGNTSGNYFSWSGSAGNIAVGDTNLFEGTSISAAYAAGIAALMLGDLRYDELPPLVIAENFTSAEMFDDGLYPTGPGDALEPISFSDQQKIYPDERIYRKGRANPLGGSILAEMARHADLPGTGGPDLRNENIFDYINGYNDRIGFGRPNAARLASLNFDTGDGATTGRSTPDSLRMSDYAGDNRDDEFIEAVLYDETFAAQIMITDAEGNFVDVFQQITDAKKGWFEDEATSQFTLIDRVVEGEEGSEIVQEKFYISPTMGPTEEINFSYREKIAATQSQKDLSTFALYVWQDTLPTVEESPESNDSFTNLNFNPQGRYQRGVTRTIHSPEIEFDNYNGEPLIVTLFLGHELGIEDTSSNPGSILQGGDNLDQIILSAEVSAEKFIRQMDPEGNVVVTTDSVELVTTSFPAITGDSNSKYKERLVSSVGIEIDDPFESDNAPLWPVASAKNSDKYDPTLLNSQMTVRPYRFVIPPAIGFSLEDEEINRFYAKLKLQLIPDDSFLPSYTFPDENGEVEQLFNVYRDHQGFIFYGARIEKVSPSYYQYMIEDEFVINTDSRNPTWVPSGNDVAMVRSDRKLNTQDLYPRYSGASDGGDPESFLDWNRFLGQPFDQTLLSDDVITSLESHPEWDLLAFTTDGGTDGLYLTTADGVNTTELLNPQLTVGARDPSWSSNGDQLIFAGDGFIRLINMNFGTNSMFPDPDDISVETIVTTELTGLTDFRTPLLDRSSGLIVFVARLANPGPDDDTSLNLYVASRSGRILNFSTFSGCADAPARDPNGPFLYGWEGIDVYDLEMSFVGHRLMFVANASAPPLAPNDCAVTGVQPCANPDDCTDTAGILGEDFFPASPSAGSKIFTIENFDHVLRFNDMPIYDEIAPTVPLPVEMVEFRRPEISPYSGALTKVDQNTNRSRQTWSGFELLYSAFPTTSDSLEASDRRQGRVLRQGLDPEVILPSVHVVSQDPVIVGPFPEPGEPEVFGQLALAGESPFKLSTEGWAFVSGGSMVDQPLSSFLVESGEIADGALRLQADNSNFTFGFWESPSGYIKVRPDALYLARASVRATDGLNNDEVSTLRLRVNSKNFESSFTAETNPTGTVELSPVSGTNRDFDLLFRASNGLFSLESNQQAYTMAFDILNVLDQSSPDAGLIMDDVTLYRMDDGGQYLALWSFRGGSSGAVVDFTALANGAIQDSISMAIRTCAGESTTDVECATGDSIAGLTLQNVSIDPNTVYHVMVSSRYAQEITLNWNVISGGSLQAASGNDGSDEFACPPLSFNENSVSISGSNGANTQRGLYAGASLIQGPSCFDGSNVTVFQNPETTFIADLTTTEGRSGWEFGPDEKVTGLTNPEFLKVSDGLGLRVLDPTNTFGFWSSSPATVPVGEITPNEDGVALYRATFTIASDRELDPLKLPVIRVRFATRDFQRSVSGQFTPLKDGVTVPSPGSPITLDLYMALEEVPSNLENFILAFDVLSFEDEKEVSSEVIKLRAVRIERLQTNQYPTPNR